MTTTSLRPRHTELQLWAPHFRVPCSCLCLARTLPWHHGARHPWSQRNMPTLESTLPPSTPHSSTQDARIPFHCSTCTALLTRKTTLVAQEAVVSRRCGQGLALWTKVCICIRVRSPQRWTETGHGVDAGFLDFAKFCYRIQRNLRILSLNLDFQVVIKVCLPNKEDTTCFIYLTVCQIAFKPSNI